MFHVFGCFLNLVHDALSYPVVLVVAVDFTKELELRSSTDLSQSLNGFLNKIVGFLSETDASLLKNFGVVQEVRDFLLGAQVSTSITKASLGFLYPRNYMDIDIFWGILLGLLSAFEIGSLHKA